MIRHRTILTAWAAVCLALAPLASPASAARPAAAALQLVTEPGQGLSPIYDLIGSARRSIDLTMYELMDPKVTTLLEQAAGQGVAVRVILDQNYKHDANEPVYDDLAANGVQVHWANPSFACTHQKTVTVDGATSAIMTLNFTPRYYGTSRDFAVITSDAADVQAIETAFSGDFADTLAAPPVGNDLVWSPTNAQARLLDLINSAGASLLVENEEMADAGVVGALCAAAGRGVAVQIVMTDQGKYGRQLGQLQDAGVQLALYPESADLYIHAKVVLADYGTAGARVFIGSENFSHYSLTRNRELGLITADPAVMASVNATLSSDFSGAQTARASHRHKRPAAHVPAA